MLYTVGKDLLVSSTSWKKISSAFKKRTFVEIYHNDKALTCNSKNTVYFPECNESVANSLLEAPRATVVIELTAIKVLTK